MSVAPAGNTPCLYLPGRQIPWFREPSRL